MNARVVALVADLMDRSRMAAVAGDRVRFVSDVPGLVAEATVSDLVVVDLGNPVALDAVGEVAGLGVRVVGFGSHVERELLDAARALGCDQVLARSAFFARLDDLLG